MLQILAILLIVALDAVTKQLALKFLEPVGSFPIIENVFHLTFHENTGAALSILEGKVVFLAVASAVACIAIAVVLIRRMVKSKIGEWGLVLILAGAIGNLIDRIFRKAVVDMFDFCLINFPVFNVADIAITVGAVFLFVYLIFFYDTGVKKKDDETKL